MAEATTEDPASRATVTTDEQGFFKAVSPQFLALIGRPVESLAGVSLTDLVHPTMRLLPGQLLAVAAGGTAGRTSLQLFADGDRWIPLRAAAVPTLDGRVTLELVGFAAAPAAIAESVEEPTVAPAPATVDQPSEPTASPAEAAVERDAEDAAAARAANVAAAARDAEEAAAVRDAEEAAAARDVEEAAAVRDVEEAAAVRDAEEAAAALDVEEAAAVRDVEEAAAVLEAEVAAAARDAEEAAEATARSEQPDTTADSAVVDAAPVADASTPAAESARRFPGDEVPAQRAAIRASAGNADTPMLELDPDSWITFVSGPWGELTTSDATGADVFVEVLETTVSPSRSSLRSTTRSPTRRRADLNSMAT